MMTSPSFALYTTLELQRDADAAEIKRAYRRDLAYEAFEKKLWS